MGPAVLLVDDSCVERSDEIVFVELLDGLKISLRPCSEN